MSPNSLRTECRKFAPNIFNKTKCSNCFKQKEEHSAQALECTRAMRKVAKSGYLFVAPGWDFSIPLNRTKRWQRRWFVLYDDGELNYSVDEHPDTVPQASIDMNQVLEVAGAEDVTGHAFSLAITAPDGVTFVKAMARDDARQWTSVLAVYTRNKGRHKRNATFPGGQTTTIHQSTALPRSGTPNPIRPRYNSCHSDSVLRPVARWNQEPSTPSPTSPLPPSGALSTSSSSSSCNSSNCRTGYRDQPPSSASPPTRDKLNSEEKALVRSLRSLPPPSPTLTYDYETSTKRLETLKDIAAVLTRPRPISTPQPTPTRDSDTDTVDGVAVGQETPEVQERVQLPAETLLHLKKGWLMVQEKEWTKMWFVLCGTELKAFKDNKEEENAEEMVIPLSQVKDVGEIQVQRNYGFQIRLWNDTVYTLSAVTSGIRLNWLHSIRRACSLDDLPPRKPFLSSDEEYRTASESGRRESGEWVPASPPLARTPISKVKERARSRSRPSSRGSTLDSVSTDELIVVDTHITCLNQLKQKENMLNETLEKFENLNRDFQSKQHQNTSLQEELNCVNERLRRGIEENDYLYKKLQELQDKSFKNSSFGSLSDLTNIDLDLDFTNLSKDSLIDEYNNLKMRFEKAVQEIRAMKRELRNSHLKFDDLELSNITLQQDLTKLQEDNKSQTEMMAARIQDLTCKLTNSEKQVRNLKSKLQDSREKRRSLSLKGKESFSINKEVEDKITELEAKILSLETKKIVKPAKKIKRDRSSDRSSPVDEKTQRRLRRKSLDSATTSEPMKVLIRLSSLESKVANCHKMDENLGNSSESLNSSTPDSKLEQNSKILALESTIEAVKQKLNDSFDQISVLKHARRQISPLEERLQPLEQSLNEISSILKSPTNISPAEVDVITSSVISVVRTFEKLLTDKLTELTNRRRALKEAGKLSNQASMAILAEKLAYETVIISRIHQAMNNSQENTKFSSKILQREVLQTGQLLQELQNKLAGIQITKMAPRSMEEYLTRVLTRHLIHISHMTNNNRNLRQQEVKQGQELKEGLEFLLQKQHEVHQQLVRYKSSKLDSLALEMLSTGFDTSTLSQTAFSCVTTELVQSEVTSALSRAAQAYTTSSRIPALSVWASERAALELWSDEVTERLQKELQTIGQELVDACSKIKPTPWRKRLELERKTVSRNLLPNLADILAHKALIDARIAVLNGEITSRTQNTSNDESLLVQNLLEGEKYLTLLEDTNMLEKNTLFDSEFQTIFLKCEENARKSVGIESCGSEVDETIKNALNGIEREVLRLQGVQVLAEETTPHTWEEVGKKCCELQQRLSLVPATCNQCEHLKDSIHRLSAEHSAEQAVLRERAQALEARLGTLDSEYALQLDQLRSAYRDALQPDPTSGGLRARYQAEIEQLRTLCEKGLSAVESAHRRVVAELQDKHRRERQQLLEEKEQALAEETQATLAALDAMRKAHEHEVRREVGKFKQDFLRKLQATHDLGALHHQHEAEMRDIREEILALSERYSVKCVESASLEEKLCDVHQQLASAHRHIKQLQLRNNQLSTLQN